MGRALERFGFGGGDAEVRGVGGITGSGMVLLRFERLGSGFWKHWRMKGLERD